MAIASTGLLHKEDDNSRNNEDGMNSVFQPARTVEERLAVLEKERQQKELDRIAVSETRKKYSCLSSSSSSSGRCTANTRQKRSTRRAQLGTSPSQWLIRAKDERTDHSLGNSRRGRRYPGLAEEGR
ncbi:hypothetical protein PMAYCL1PPCAC_09942 [Pristionchus mayeri]|uniref:Uncharacterized protein n=1 Tax=Pristionchus mayeri TaxID=1317129 RepID=A0AAN4ZKB2_9BILA|nr:hypothetical protein PMAYCL1PPCAC_09942 [Pristionchus mayeri]